ncbi:MAG: hypothetical protein Q9O74_03980 [Planctomycetota bacterium]|nr:hypothetical protein [Planctomycetota bacterium]
MKHYPAILARQCAAAALVGIAASAAADVGDADDVDIAALHDRLTERYGPDLAVGDQDGDGARTYEDIVAAIEQLLRESPGATTDIELAARHAAAALGTRIEATHRQPEKQPDAAKTHLTDASNAWPADHPGWWRPNHLVNISARYEGKEADPLEHLSYTSSRHPTAPHQTHISSQWPANHLWYASSTWLPPATPNKRRARSPDTEPPEYHKESVSKYWHAGHLQEITSTYPDDHNPVVSRVWWTNHRYWDSMRLLTPEHLDDLSMTWSHETAPSLSRWPPNHTQDVSETWKDKEKAADKRYPPGHSGEVSETWTRPQPTWPAGHVGTVSESWGRPASGR